GLVVPHDLPGVRVDGERTGRVEVAVGVDGAAVVAADRRAPRRGIAGPVVEEIQRRIVRADVPGHAAPELPRVALPGVVAGLFGPRPRSQHPHHAARALAEWRDLAPPAV